MQQKSKDPKLNLTSAVSPTSASISSVVTPGATIFPAAFKTFLKDPSDCETLKPNQIPQSTPFCLCLTQSRSEIREPDWRALSMPHLASLQESLILSILSSPFTSGSVGDGGGRPELVINDWRWWWTLITTAVEIDGSVCDDVEKRNANQCIENTVY